MKYKIELFKSAAREFSSLPKDVQARAVKIFNILQIDPFSEILKIRKLKGHRDLFRIRVGDYRIIYKIEEPSILIVRIRHRKNVYENLS